VRTSLGLQGLVFGGLGSGLTDVTGSSHRSTWSPNHAEDCCSCLYQQRESRSSRKTNSRKEKRWMRGPQGAGERELDREDGGREGRLPRSTGEVQECWIAPASLIRKIIIRKSLY